MPANTVFPSQRLTDLKRVCDHVAVLLHAVGHEVPAAVIASAVMNSAATCDDETEICFKTFTRLSEEAAKRD